MTTLTQASHQWATRPDDQRFVNLHDMALYMERVKAASRAAVVANRDIEARPVGSNHKDLELYVSGQSSLARHIAAPTHYSFGQLAARAKAPAGYLRTLPSEMAADCINYGLTVRTDVEDLGMLVNQETGELRCATGPNYGRIWNIDIVNALRDKFGDGISGQFRVPGEFGKAVAVDKANTTLYASDRDMFVFLADETNRITIPNRRNGQSGSLARGFMISNSEVGDSTLWGCIFYFDYACSNRTIWGADGIKEFRIRHTAGAPHKWIESAHRQLMAFANQTQDTFQSAVIEAQKVKLGDEEAVDAFLMKRFSRSQTNGIVAAHLTDEQRPIETLWDASVAVTAYARDIEFQKERVAMEKIGGDLLRAA